MNDSREANGRHVTAIGLNEGKRRFATRAAHHEPLTRSQE
jgi:hypothetical protein